jgi:hypothetical protein
VLNVPLMDVAIEEMTVRIATPTNASITAYSTAVGPSSLPKKCRNRLDRGRIVVSMAGYAPLGFAASTGGDSGDSKLAPGPSPWVRLLEVPVGPPRLSQS